MSMVYLKGGAVYFDLSFLVGKALKVTNMDFKKT